MAADQGRRAQRDAPNPWSRPELPCELAQERSLSRRAGAIAGDSTEGHECEPFRLNSEVDCCEAHHAPHQQPRTRCQHQRQRELRGDERVPPPRGTDAVARAFAAVMQGGREVATRRAEHGQDGNRQPRRDRHESEEQRHAPVAAGRSQARIIRRHSRGREAGEHGGDRQTGDGARENDQDMLDRDLPHERTASGTQRDPYGELAPSGEDPRKREVRDVHAGNEQEDNVAPSTSRSPNG